MNIVRRYATGPDLADGVAHRLHDRIVALQAEFERPVQLCLTGGRIANRIYQAFTDLIPGSQLDPGRLELWWGDERFVPTEDPERNAGHTLAILAGKLPLAPGLTHPMPAADGFLDNAASAAAYAKELGDTVFDLCLLGMGPDGHVAWLFPNHPSFEDAGHRVIPVNDSPRGAESGISLSLPTLRSSREVWYLVVGADKADAVRRSYAGDQTIPAGAVRGTDRTVWLVDRAAAAGLPYHTCSF